MSNNRTVLLVEDNDDDVVLLRIAWKNAKFELPIQVASDGQEAVAYLSGEGAYQDREQHPLPSLVLLDLKLPYMHGFDVLAWMREQPALKDIPVVVLTSSPEDRDQRRAEELGAKAYLVKPPTSQMMVRVIETYVIAPVAGDKAVTA